jgi:hypothetical protein
VVRSILYELNVGSVRWQEKKHSYDQDNLLWVIKFGYYLLTTDHDNDLHVLTCSLSPVNEAARAREPGSIEE